MPRVPVIFSKTKWTEPSERRQSPKFTSIAFTTVFIHITAVDVQTNVRSGIPRKRNVNPSVLHPCPCRCSYFWKSIDILHQSYHSKVRVTPQCEANIRCCHSPVVKHDGLVWVSWLKSHDPSGHCHPIGAEIWIMKTLTRMDAHVHILRYTVEIQCWANFSRNQHRVPCGRAAHRTVKSTAGQDIHRKHNVGSWNMVSYILTRQWIAWMQNQNSYSYIFHRMILSKINH